MKRRVFLTLFAAVLPLLAQEAKPIQPKEGWVSKVFDIKNQDANRLALLVGAFGADVRPSPQLKAIAVTGPPAVVDAVGEAIKRFDVPLRNVELTTYLVMGQPRETQATAVPKELEGVVKQLRGLFLYQGFQVLDTAVLRAREGQAAQVNGGFSPPAETTYRLELSSLAVTTEGKDHIVRVDRLRFAARMPYTVVRDGKEFRSVRDAGLQTDIDVREGQKVVVGKASVDDSGNALILVVTAKVVD
ncbi:MAG: hypothetical protein ACE141_08335 [Bryobacteraceae bacterium]